ncbi:MAG: hypothetical protein V4692_03065, partial [Bdellovibrionota bacterium]
MQITLIAASGSAGDVLDMSGKFLRKANLCAMAITGDESRSAESFDPSYSVRPELQEIYDQFRAKADAHRERRGYSEYDYEWLGRS